MTSTRAVGPRRAHECLSMGIGYSSSSRKESMSFLEQSGILGYAAKGRPLRSRDSPTLFSSPCPSSIAAAANRLSNPTRVYQKASGLHQHPNHLHGTRTRLHAAHTATRNNRILLVHDSSVYAQYSLCIDSYPLRFAVVQLPTNDLALRNRVVVHPRDFDNNQHVLIKGAFPVTTLCAISIPPPTTF
jgi:hypothetical protein